ncbi:uncharacterized protein BDR25DRAFT_343797 [Lindgomyces ingoldianus]|uniref:Uncharacterized protein n=1 Tax=Lindgomyces ingoldianus TaxID=673940 RepID=A0ACB6QR38_9PLEO|nr:uncharacterized protein BDR25DRAFT_343797 [Lindgomyces ingoldianus]KAF2469453.1 hypothetical protein BDR25DRAFT_343797 [Lindgomyces ingoldianus]
MSKPHIVDDEEVETLNLLAKKVLLGDAKKREKRGNRDRVHFPEKEPDTAPPGDEADTHDPAGEACVEESSPVVRKRVRFLVEVLPARKSDSVVPFNPKPPPPPPPPPLPASFWNSEPQPISNKLPPLPPPPPPSPPPPPPGFWDTPLHPQPIFTPADDGDAYINKAAFKLYTKFMDELAEFAELQGEVLRKRVDAQEKRAQARIFREQIRQCDSELFKYLRRSVVNEGIKGDQELERLFGAAQRARDQLVPFDDIHEAVDVELGAAEFALTEHYATLESRYENFFKLRAGSTSTAGIVPSSISFEKSSENEGDEDSEEEIEPRHYTLFHGAILGDRVKVGEVPLMVDTFLDGSRKSTPTPKSAGTTSRRPMTTRIKSTDGYTEPLGLSRRPVQSFTEDVATLPRSKIHKLRDELLPHDLEPLQDLASSKDIAEMLRGIGGALMTTSEHTDLFLESMTLEEYVVMEDIASDIPERPEDTISIDPLSGDGDSLLLLDTDMRTKSTLSEYLLIFNSTRDRVNKWLLHKLRVSPFEIFELRWQVSSRNAYVPDWECSVLDLWYKDALGLSQAHAQGSEEESVVTPPPFYAITPRGRRAIKSKQIGPRSPSSNAICGSSQAGTQPNLQSYHLVPDSIPKVIYDSQHSP